MHSFSPHCSPARHEWVSSPEAQAESKALANIRCLSGWLNNSSQCCANHICRTVLEIESGYLWVHCQYTSAGKRYCRHTLSSYLDLILDFAMFWPKFLVNRRHWIAYKCACLYVLFYVLIRKFIVEANTTAFQNYFYCVFVKEKNLLMDTLGPLLSWGIC